MITETEWGGLARVHLRDHEREHDHGIPVGAGRRRGHEHETWPAPDAPRVLRDQRPLMITEDSQ